MDNMEPVPGVVSENVSSTEPTIAKESYTQLSIKPVNIEKTRHELLDVRTISKKNDPEGRSATAQEILEARIKKLKIEKESAEKEARLEEVKAQQAKQTQELTQKTNELQAKLNSILFRLKSAVGLDDKQIIELQAEIEKIRTEENLLLTEAQSLEEYLKTLRTKRAEIPNAKLLLKAYYEEIATQPLTNGEKRQLLKPETLASLNMEEYIALWKRLNPYFLSHVTRQGFRDHHAISSHNAGLNEFTNGFISVMEDQEMLRPRLALEGLKTRDNESVKQFLSEWVLQAKDEVEAKKRLNALLRAQFTQAPAYPDQTAVHFAAQLVADKYYGGERDNEIFFVFPSDTVASQYNFAFNGREKDFTKSQSETAWNDVFVWPNTTDNPGISINTGVVFLPKNIPVDPNTGSKYASEVGIIEGQERRMMIEDTTLIKSFVEWGKSLNTQSPIVQQVIDYQEESNFKLKQIKEDACFQTITQELKKIGFSSGVAQALGHRIKLLLYLNETITEEGLQTMFRDNGVPWKRAETTIPAKEYWESYFAKNPHLRPKHIEYYDGDPTSAVWEFIQKNNIGRADTSKTQGNLLGFNDHHIVLNDCTPYDLMNEDQDPRAMRGYEELKTTANKIISERYRIR